METTVHEIDLEHVHEIENLIEVRNWQRLKGIVKDTPVQDLAKIYSNLDETIGFLFFRNLPRDLAADVFSYLEPQEQEDLLTRFTKKETKQILVELPPDDRTAVLEELPGELTQKILYLLPPDELKATRELLGYPEDSVGRIMTPDYVAVKDDVTAAEAIKHIKKYGKNKETINVVYVTDENRKLIGEFKLRSLILSSGNKFVSNLMDTNIITLSAFDDQEKAVTILQTYDKVAIPVVDSKNTLIGIVTFDDIMDVAQEEVTEDIHKSGSVQPLGTDYSQAGVRQLFFKRVVWLLLLLSAGFVSSWVISIFKGSLAKMPALSFFIPVLLGSGGNTGAQSTTLIIRAIATGDVKLSAWLKVFLKELWTGVILGLTLGILSIILTYFIGGDWRVVIAVSLSMVFLILWANLIGAMLPIFITKMKFDPAVISNPMITTIVDISGLFIYFLISGFTYKLNL